MGTRDPAAVGLFLFLCVAGCHTDSGSRANVFGGSSVSIPLAPSGRDGSPRDFTIALTGGGPPPVWIVRDDPSAPGGRVLVQETKDETSYRFPLCIYDRITATDVSAETSWKAISGTVDQAAGLVLRYTPENYYVARANPLEDNVNLFKTVNGNRLKLAEVAVKAPANEWHTLGFAARGTKLTVTLNGKTVIEMEDATFTGPGKVGYWTKADSVTAFSNLRVTAEK